MKWSRHEYSRGVVPWPSLLIALGWIGIWFAWPLGADSGSKLESSTVVSVIDESEIESSLYRPDTFLPSASGFTVADVENVPVSIFREEVHVPPRFLAKDEALPRLRIRDSVLVYSLDDARRYAPLYREQPIFDRMQEDSLHVLTIVEGALRERGFAVPDLSKVLEGKTERPWTVEMDVRVDAEGRVCHVFLLSRSQDDELNTALVRKMYFAKLVPVDSECSGRVVISCGRR